jgi:hypothetical protein
VPPTPLGTRATTSPPLPCYEREEDGVESWAGQGVRRAVPCNFPPVYRVKPTYQDSHVVRLLELAHDTNAKCVRWPSERRCGATTGLQFQGAWCSLGIWEAMKQQPGSHWCGATKIRTQILIIPFKNLSPLYPSPLCLTLLPQYVNNWSSSSKIYQLFFHMRQGLPAKDSRYPMWGTINILDLELDGQI